MSERVIRIFRGNDLTLPDADRPQSRALSFRPAATAVPAFYAEVCWRDAKGLKNHLKSSS